MRWLARTPLVQWLLGKVFGGMKQAVTLHFKAGVSKRVWVLMGWVVNDGPTWAEVKRTWLGR